MIDTTLHLLIASGVCVASAACCLPIIRSLRLGGTPLEEWTLASGLGLGVLSLVTTMACLMGIFNSTFAWVSFALLLLGGAVHSNALREGAFSAAQTLQNGWKHLTVPGRCLALCCIALILSALIIALAPPRISDTAEYHLALAKLFRLNGGYDHHPTWLPASYPLNATMLFGFEMLLSPRNTVAMSWCIWMILIGSMVMFGARWFGSKSGWAFIPLWLGTGITYYLAEGNSDGFACLQWLLCAHAFGLWLKDGKGSILILSAFFAGTCMGTKYNGLIAVGGWTIALAFCGFIWPRMLKRAGGSLGLLGIALVVALGVGAPWYVRNVVYEGNPVFPLFSRFFGSAELPEVPDGRLSGTLGLTRSLAGLGLSPLLAGVTTNIPMANAWQHHVWGPWFMAFLPLAFWLGGIGGIPRFIIGWSLFLVYLGYWPTAGFGRHLFPFVQTLGPAAGFTLVSLKSRMPRLFTVVAGLCILTTAPVVAFTLTKGALLTSVVLGLESEKAFLDRHMPSEYAIILEVNRRLSASDRLLAMDVGVPGVHFDIPWWYGTPDRRQALIKPERWIEAGRFYEDMAAGGFTHIYINRTLIETSRLPVRAGLTHSLACCAKFLVKAGDIELHEVWRPEPPRAGPANQD